MYSIQNNVKENAMKLVLCFDINNIDSGERNYKSYPLSPGNIPGSFFDALSRSRDTYDIPEITIDTLKIFVMKNETKGSDDINREKIKYINFIPGLFKYCPLKWSQPDLPENFCNDKNMNKMMKLKIIDPKSKNNNCGISCLLRGLDINGNKVKPNLIRKKYNIELNIPINCELLGDIANLEFNINLIIINPLGKELLNTNTEYSKSLYLLLEDHHYSLIDFNEIKQYKICNHCGEKTLNTNTSHKCKSNRIEYNQTQIKKIMLPLKDNRYNKKIFKSKINYDNDILYFDFETVQANNVFDVYAVGFINNGIYQYYYGKDSLSLFVDYLIQNVKDKQLCAFNGGRFDNILLFKELINRNITMSNYIKNNGRLLQYSFNNNKMFDLYNHIGTSLKDACKNYCISQDKSKKEFDHSLMNNWNDVEYYRNDVIPYLHMDLVSMKELFRILNDEVYELQGVNITDYLTTSSMSFDCWRREIYEMNKTRDDKIMIEIPNKNKYDIIKKAVYGGRVCCYQKKYINKKYDELDNKLIYSDVANSNDYIFNADVNSLYPASMAGCDIVSVAYPIGESRMNNNGELEFNNGKYGFYDIEYIPPLLNYPVLPRRLLDGGISWDLIPSSGTYTNIDIKDAISVGYKIKFLGNCLVYDQTNSDIFKSYVQRYYNIKKDEDNKPEQFRNNARRNLCKLMMNALYGKTLQKANFENDTVVHSLKDVYNFLNTYELTEWTFLDNDKMILKGIVKIEDEAINKPMQLGAFVLSYSRRIMLNYNKILDPSLTKIVATYSDTDSLHVTAEYYKKLYDLGLIKSELGYMSNDIKNDGLIIQEINLGSKMYMYKYINKSNQICTTMKTKGLPTRNLKEEFFNNESGIITISNSFKKVFETLNKKDVVNDIGMYTIRKIDITRSFNSNPWTGRVLDGNVYLPHGYGY